MEKRLDTAVALIIFNRPDTTEVVFSEIAKARPKRLFVIADGPRADRPDDKPKCDAARAVIDRVNWDCEVFKNYSEINLGCGYRPATGISWVFDQVEEAIILEDDCVPDSTFFRFCDELLKRYRENSSVMMISGSNRWWKRKKTRESYFFSLLPWTLGWATWRRAWRHYDIKISNWAVLRKTLRLRSILRDPKVVEYWSDIFDRAYAANGDVDYWDYQWAFMFFEQNGLCIYPNKNLICNIGFREDATHIKDPNHFVANMPTSEMNFPLKHPPNLNFDAKMHNFLIARYLHNNDRYEWLYDTLRKNKWVYEKLKRIRQLYRNQKSNIVVTLNKR